MDGYLVMASCTCDDVPVSWHVHRGEAFDAGEALKGVPADLQPMFPESDFAFAKIVVFRGGRPVEVIPLRSTDTLWDELHRNIGPVEGE